MQKAKNVDNDEFYTRYEDVEKELSMYDKGMWKNKVVFCNCDDAVDNCYIPNDYKKPFGVSARSILNGLLEKGYKIVNDKEYYPYVSGEKCYSRALVQKI
jgi:hypothetical protein